MHDLPDDVDSMWQVDIQAWPVGHTPVDPDELQQVMDAWPSSKPEDGGR